MSAWTDAPACHNGVLRSGERREGFGMERG